MTDVTWNRAQDRFELRVDDELAIAVYRLHDDVVDFVHTEVPPSLEGRGVGSRLIRGALDDVRAKGLQVKASCPFVAAYLERHPEAATLASDT